MHRRAAIQAAAALLATVASPGASSGASSGTSGAAQASSEPFRLAYFETYSPLSFYENGVLRGILVDVLEEMFIRLGVPHLHEGFPWPRAQALVQRGERDAICTIATPQRLEYAEAADEPVVTAPTCIFVREDHPMLQRLSRVQNLEGLRALGLSVLSYAANGWAKAKLEGFNVLWGNDFNSSLKMLVAKRGDVMVENALTMQYSLKHIAGGEAVRMLPNRVDQANFQLLVSKLSPHVGLLPEFSRVLARFKQTPGYAEIFQRYGVRI